MADSNATELQSLSKLKIAGRLRYWRGTIEIPETELHAICDEIQAEHNQAIAAILGRIEEPDTIRNELADGGLIADVLAPVCVDEKERRAFERGKVHERFAQQIFKEATS